MRHLREFEEWNPEEWDDEAMDVESSSMSDMGFKEFGPGIYGIEFNFPMDYRLIQGDTVFNGIVLRLIGETQGIDRNQETEFLAVISDLCSAGGDPMSIQKIISIEDGRDIDLSIDASSRPKMGDLTRLYKTLDRFIAEDKLALYLAQFGDGSHSFGYPPFIYTESISKQSADSAEELGEIIFNSFRKAAYGEDEKKFELIEGGNLAERFILANSSSEHYRKHMSSRCAMITIGRRNLEDVGSGFYSDENPDVSFTFRFNFQI